MEEIENQDQLTLPTKRKLDPICENKESEEEFECLHSIKAQKIQSLTTSGNSHEHNPSEVAQNGNQSVEACTTNSGLNSSKPRVDIKNAEMEANGHEEEGEDDDEEEEVNGKDVTVDRKGKGIMIEELDTDDDDEEDDDEDDDSSDDGSELEDDPLAEVDLDNILPSRTRRRSVHPGVYLANDFPSNEEDDDSDE